MFNDYHKFSFLGLMTECNTPAIWLNLTTVSPIPMDTGADIFIFDTKQTIRSWFVIQDVCV